MSEMPEDVFQRIGDTASEAVRAKVSAMLVAAEHPEAVQAVILGALAGVIKTFASFANPTTTRERLMDVAAETARDFAGQAFDELMQVRNGKH